MICPAAALCVPVEVQNAVVIGIGHYVARSPCTNHKISDLCVTVVLHTMTNWITSLEGRGVAWSHNDASVSFVKCDFALQNINHLVFARMPMFN